MLDTPPKWKRKRRRTPGWVAVCTSTLVAALMASGLTVVGLQASGLLNTGTQSVVPQEKGSTAEVAPVVNSQASAADWKAVNEAVGKTVVLIQVRGETGADTGSGVIIDKEAHIVTNNHVIANAQANGEIRVTLNDGRIYKAKIVGTDPSTDLAVIKLVKPPTDLTAARLGNSAKLEVGQPVAAIGAPLGLRATMTTGIISALDRPTVVSKRDEYNRPGAEVITNSIQVDASINPGNSGGPLFDDKGRVIGINSSIISLGGSQARQAGSIGLGFAIPVNLVKKISGEIISTGHATHALLGISAAPAVTTIDGIARNGAEVKEITSLSKMGAAGLRRGDVIVAINGQPVSDSLSLIGYVRRYSPGDRVTLQVARDGKLLKITGELINAASIN
ncbi:trypsin-like peptidase domain-containing protein [Actinomycetaceae bacterium TAE3-ERU4]|nr:trypsin-like peptidase domain-containing protein [Actinomycetaceae bacterium TAE3-ERU4]